MESASRAFLCELLHKFYSPCHNSMPIVMHVMISCDIVLFFSSSKLTKWSMALDIFLILLGIVG